MRRLFAMSFRPAKRFIAAILFGIGVALIGLTLFWFSAQSVAASTTGQKTLSAGQTLTISPNGCNLSVTSKSASQVKVKCAVKKSGAIAADAATANAVTLKAGKKLTVNANACSLNLLKQKKTLVKIKCNGATPTPTQSSGATVHVAPGGDLKFSQASVTIHQGESVEWIWDAGPHTVTSTSDNGASADSNFCSPNDTNCSVTNTSSTGATYSHTFDTTGTFVYYCHFHGYAAMHAQVVVEP